MKRGQFLMSSGGQFVVSPDNKLKTTDMTDLAPAEVKRVPKCTRRCTFQGETLSIPEWSARLGITKRLIYSRLGRGWTIEQALTGTPPAPRRNLSLRLTCRPERRIAFDGMVLTIGEWSTRLGITKNALHGRFKNGWPLDRALTQPAMPNRHGHRQRLITFRDETLTLRQWADRLDLDPTTIIVRLNRSGWPLDRALTTRNIRGQRTPQPANDDRPLDVTA